MNKRYVIQWKSRVNGRSGKGTKVFNREEAENLVEELNREYPDIQHEILDSANPGEARIGRTELETTEEESTSPTASPSRVLSFQE
jgi:hypothetical protein